MTQFLPTSLLALFSAREPIPYLPPSQPLTHEKRTHGYSGLGEYVKFFETEEPPVPPPYVTREEQRLIRQKQKAEVATYRLEQEIALWNPTTNPKATTDPTKTLFVGRIQYDVRESKLRREFEEYGPVKSITMVKHKKTNKFKGYAFVEFENEQDMLLAYKKADGQKIGGRRIVVDVERGRTKKSWLPRRLGGGLGMTRRGVPSENILSSGRGDGPPRDRDRDRNSPHKDEKLERQQIRFNRSRSRDRDRKVVDEKRGSRKSDRRGNSRDRVARVSRASDRMDPRKSTRDDSSNNYKRKSSKRSRSRSADRKRRRGRSRSKNRKRDKEDREHRDLDKDKSGNRDKDKNRARHPNNNKDRDSARKHGDREDPKITIKPDPDALVPFKIKDEPKDDLEVGEIQSGTDDHELNDSINIKQEQCEYH